MIATHESSHDGIHDYLRYGRKDVGRSPDEVKVVESNLKCSMEYPSDIKDEMRLQKEKSTSRKEVNKYLFQCVISHHKSDTKKAEDKEKEVISEFKKQLKDKKIDLDKTQHYIIKHTDKENIHYHLIYNKVSNNGKSINVHNAHKKVMSIANDISKKMNFVNAKEMEQKRKREQENSKDKKNAERKTYVQKQKEAEANRRKKGLKESYNREQEQSKGYRH